jgi:hypothetical protein
VQKAAMQLTKHLNREDHMVYRRRPSDSWRRITQEQGVVFDPECIELMTDAYLAACQILGLKEHLDDGVTRLVALRIIKAAANGERDPDKLYEQGVRNFAWLHQATQRS